MKIRRSLFNMSDVAWFDHPHGDHVPLPLDVSQVSDAVVSRMIQSYYHEMYEKTTPNIHGAMRAAITALAAALGGEG
jgi:hypothetical protein